MSQKWRRSNKNTWKYWQRRGMPASRPHRFVLSDLLKNLPPFTLPSTPSLQGSAFLEAIRRVRSDMDGLFGSRVENGRLVDRSVNIPLPNTMLLQQELRASHESARQLRQDLIHEARQRDRPQYQSGYPCGRPWVMRLSVDTSRIRASMDAMRSRLASEPMRQNLTTEYSHAAPSIGEILERVSAHVRERFLESSIIPASVLYGQPSQSAPAESPAPPRRSQHWQMVYTPQGSMGVCHAAIDGMLLRVPLVAVEFSRPWESHTIGTIVFRPEWLAREWGGWGARTVAPDHHVFFLDEHEFNGIVMPADDEHQPGFSLKVQMDNLQIRALAGGVKLVEWDTPPMTARHVERLAQQSDRRSVSVGYTCTVDPAPGSDWQGQSYDAIQRHVDIRSVSLRRDMEMLGFANPERPLREDLEIVARHRNEGYQRLFERHTSPPRQHQSTAVIDNTSCAYYVESTWLKCTVNPSGPCDGCGHYEPLGADLEP